MSTAAEDRAYQAGKEPSVTAAGICIAACTTMALAAYVGWVAYIVGCALMGIAP